MASKANLPAQPKADQKTAKDLGAPATDSKPPKDGAPAKEQPANTTDPKLAKDGAAGKPQGGEGPDSKLAKTDPKSTRELGHSDAKLPLIHIDNFDVKKFHVINSPRSREAMKELGIQDADLHLKTADDLRGMFNLADPEEKKAFDVCVKKHEAAHKNLVKKISARRKEMIKQKEDVDRKRKEHEQLKSKQLKHLEEEKKAILKTLELENKKKEELEKKNRQEHEKTERESKKENKPSSPTEVKNTDKAKPPVNPSDEKSKKLDLQASTKSVSPDKKAVGEQHPLRERSAVTHRSDNERKLRLEDELKESTILVFLDKSAQHKEQLDLDLKERTKRDLERDKQRMKELMKKQKMDLIEQAQKRNASAYKSHENLGNAKTRKIEYLYDLSRNPLQMMKEKQQKEMESMMNYEIALQVDEHHPGD